MVKNKRKIIRDMLFEVYDKGVQNEECNLDFYYEKMMQVLNIPCVIKSVCDRCDGKPESECKTLCDDCYQDLHGMYCFITDECMSSSRTHNLIRSRKLNINKCNSLKSLTAIAYTLC